MTDRSPLPGVALGGAAIETECLTDDLISTETAAHRIGMTTDAFYVWARRKHLDPVARVRVGRSTQALWSRSAVLDTWSGRVEGAPRDLASYSDAQLREELARRSAHRAASSRPAVEQSSPETAALVLAFLGDTPPGQARSLAEIGAACGIGRSTAGRAVRRLLDAGSVTVSRLGTGDGYASVYTVTASPDTAAE